MWGLFNPLGLADYQTLVRSAMRDRSSRLYQFLNVRYLVVRKGERPPGPAFRPAFTQAPSVDIYENTDALPRAFVVYDAIPAESRAAALAAVTAPDFDPARTVVLELTPVTPRRPPASPGAAENEGPRSPVPESLPPPVEEEGNGGQAEVQRVGPDRLRVRAQAARAGWLVLSEPWYRGWQAVVDGHPAPVRRANFIFRAVPLEAGVHEIDLWFAPQSFAVGAAMSAVALALGLGLLLAPCAALIRAASPSARLRRAIP
jgi:hypothetical protein